MERNKKDCPEKELSMLNNTPVNSDSDEEIDKKKPEKYKVNFHSDYVNEVVGKLDITV